VTNKILLANEHLSQVLMPTMKADMNSWSPETCWPAWTSAWFAACVNKEVSLTEKRSSDLCAWIHWTIVSHISGPTYVAHLKQMLMLIGKQMFIGNAILLGWSSALKKVSYAAVCMMR